MENKKREKNKTGKERTKAEKGEINKTERKKMSTKTGETGFPCIVEGIVSF